MSKLITKETFKQKVVEGFIVGVMVSLTVAICGIVWTAFDKATERLASAEVRLIKQSGKLESQRDFNGELIGNLGVQQGVNEKQLAQLATNLQKTQTSIEKKISELATAMNNLHKDGQVQTNPKFSKSFGKLERTIEFDPTKLNLPDFKRIARDYEDIVKQEQID